MIRSLVVLINNIGVIKSLFLCLSVNLSVYYVSMSCIYISTSVSTYIYIIYNMQIFAKNEGSDRTERRVVDPSTPLRKEIHVLDVKAPYCFSQWLG